jgi:hypothetical protein
MEWCRFKSHKNRALIKRLKSISSIVGVVQKSFFLSMSKHNISNEQILFIIKERQKTDKEMKNRQSDKILKTISKIKIKKKKDGGGERNQSSLPTGDFSVKRRLGFFFYTVLKIVFST